MELENLATEKPSSSARCKNIVILGGGLLGTELAYSLNRRYARDNKNPKLKIIQIAHEQGGFQTYTITHILIMFSGILSEILPKSLCHYSTKVLNTQGIEILSDTNIDAITLNKKEGTERIQLKLSKNGINNAKELLCDHLILADGNEPAIELVRNSQLPMDKVISFVHFLILN